MKETKNVYKQRPNTCLSLIVATGTDNAIGKDLQLIWHLPNDLKHFKTLTTGRTIIMGRKTFESLPKGALPNRRNIVLTAAAEEHFPGCTVCRSIAEALTLCAEEEEVFIIGGAQIYEQTLPMANKLYLTRVHATFDTANRFFPSIGTKEWIETEREEHPADEKHAFAYSFLTYERR